MKLLNSLFILSFLTLGACNNELPKEEVEESTEPITDNRIPVIFDTDANNELDDQHALAYLLFNSDVFNLLGVTINKTMYGGGVDEHAAEAKRVADLCRSKIDIYKGADADFNTIKTSIAEEEFDGAEAVNFIIEKAKENRDGKLLLLPVGKLTNVALALEKAPEIASKVRILWLGSNYPEPREYNQDNDTASLNYILDAVVDFEIAMVRYGKDSGTDAVRVSPEIVEANYKGKGPKAEQAVEGRHGGTFTTFGDYAYNLFQHIDLYGDPPSRALFDMAAVAIAKNPDWAKPKMIPAPKLVDNTWIERADNPRKIIIWEYFDSKAILLDFYQRLDNYVLPE